MSLSTMKARERSEPMERLQLVEASPSARHAERSRALPLWIPEDIEEPETWSLASFDDVVPHELV